MNLGLALATTLVVYGLHRSILAPRAAALAAFTVMLGFATATLFLRSPWPVLGLGFFGTLLVVWGLFRAGRAVPPRLNATLIAGGVAFACLSKHEFAFASVGASAVAWLTLLRVRCEGIARASALREIAIGTGAGVATAGLVYGALALESGWRDVWAGMRGYGLLAESPELLSGAWFQSWPVVSMVVLLACAGWLVLSLQARALLGNAVWPIGVTMSLTALALAIAFRSGVLERVSSGEVAWLDGSMWMERLRRTSPRTWIRFAGFLTHALLWSLVSALSLVLLARWIRRWLRRESVTHQQWLAWVLVVCAQAIALRAVINTASPLNTWAFILLACLLGAEFPQWAVQRASSRSLALGALLLCGMLCGFARGWQVAPKESVWMSTPYGRARVAPETRAFLGEVVDYIERNSSASDAIVVLGRWAGIWYLSQRRDPLRAGYQVAGMGLQESDAAEFLQELERAAPPLLLAPQGGWHVGILDLSSDQGLPASGERVPAFEGLAEHVEQRILEDYAFDCLLNGGTIYELAAFKRVP
jgi:hypothetical protein